MAQIRNCARPPQYLNQSTDHSLSHQSASSSDDSFEEVQKTRKGKKQFLEEQPRKKKTELCRNYQIAGSCKFGNNCFFAHNSFELRTRSPIKNQPKTKPCRRYFSGFCIYGPKCQYIHSECIDLPEQREFIEKTFKEYKLMVPLNPEKLENTLRSDLQRFHHLYKIFGRKLNFKRDDLLINSCRGRLSVFTNLCKKQDRFEQLLMSNNTSRKESEQC